MKHNAIALYHHFKQQIENPQGVDALERSAVRINCKNALFDLENRFKTSKKYRDDPEVQALISGKTKKPKEEKKEDGEKSKG